MYRELLDKARQRPETLYGSSPSQIARANIQTLVVAGEFPSVMQDLIAVGVKMHFVYCVVAKNNAYKGPLPDVFEDRPGQMDAFGIASGLVAIHARRPDNSFLEFVGRDNPNSPIFSGFSKPTLGVDPNRTMVNTSVSRFGLAALVMEACRIYGLNNQGQPGADWCVPKGDWQARLDEYFRDTPRRVAEGTNGYKADMLHGVWAQAPYLHNGSVPTLGQLVCPATRPVRFLRGNLYYDEALVGFEWSERPKTRYAPNDTILIVGAPLAYLKTL